MWRILKPILTLTILTCVWALYGYQFSYLPIICDAAQNPVFCPSISKLYFLYWTSYAIWISFFILSWVFSNISLWKSILLFFIGMVSMITSHEFSMMELQNIQTHSYETFIISFYYWLASIVVIAAASALFTQTTKKLLLISAFVTIISTIIFAQYGRGGVEHITPLIGGLLAEISWKTFELNKLLFFLIYLIFSVVIYGLGRLAFFWVRDNKIEINKLGKAILAGGMLAIICSTPLLSIPIGIKLHEKDVEKSKIFIDKIIPKLETYYEENKEYPKGLDELEITEKTPRLIKNYEYLIGGLKGGYYYSRAKKYCFLFQDPGKDFGYLSKTSERDWKHFSRLTNLEEAYLDICDESQDFNAASMVAGHLDLQGKVDPVAELGTEVGEVERPASSLTASEKLGAKLDDLARNSPEILNKGSASNLPDSTESLKQMLESLERKEVNKKLRQKDYKAAIEQLERLKGILKNIPEAERAEAFPSDDYQSLMDKIETVILNMKEKIEE